MKKNFRQSWIPIAGLILAMFIWASSFAAMKFALQAYGPLVVVFARMGLASLIFLTFFQKIRSFTYHKGDWKLLILMALCEPCFFFLFESYALTYTSASQAGIISALLPVCVAIMAGVFLGESTTVVTIAGFVMALGGIVMMTFSGQPTQNAPNPLLGNVLEMLAMGCAAGYTVLARHLGPRYSPWFLTAIQMFMGTLFFSPALLFQFRQIPSDWAPIPTVAIVYLGGIVSVLAYSLYNYGLQHIPASRASAYVNLIPVFAVILGWIFLDEQLTVIQGVGMAVVMTGVWMSSAQPKQVQDVPLADSCR